MKCFVTGASGFIGANLVHELCRRGHDVKALLRPGADLRGLRGTEYVPVETDLADVAGLTVAVSGCDWCFHVAASYALWLPDYAPMYAANVEGTRNLLRAAASAGCSRIVYTSTVGCLRPARVVGGQVVPSTEADEAALGDMTNHYKRSKWKAEAVAREAAAKGLPVVIVNPSAPIGPRDVKPSPTGKLILDFLKRKMPSYVDTGLNWVHVRDVAAGHVLAAEKGRPGERYILGHRTGNWTMKQTLDKLAEVTGLRAPRFPMPYFAALGVAHVSEFISRFTGKPPLAPLGGVRMARYKMYFDPSKAVTELGLPQTSPREAFSDAVEWFRENGYVD